MTNHSKIIVLEPSERDDIEEILRRRANEIASFKTDLEENISRAVDQKIKFYSLPGSIELALSREMERLRRLADKIKFPTEEDES